VSNPSIGQKRAQEDSPIEEERPARQVIIYIRNESGHMFPRKEIYII